MENKRKYVNSTTLSDIKSACVTHGLYNVIFRVLVGENDIYDKKSVAVRKKNLRYKVCLIMYLYLCDGDMI